MTQWDASYPPSVLHPPDPPAPDPEQVPQPDPEPEPERS